MCNIRGGFNSKLDEIARILLVSNVDVAVLVETWLHGGIHDDLIRSPEYFAFRKDCDDGRVGGGILVYVRNGLPFHAQPQLDKVDLEVLWLLYRRPLMPREVSFAHSCRRHLPPSLSPKWTDVRSPRFNYGMDTVSREHPYTDCILLGVFNQLPEGQLRSCPLKQIVAGHTRNSATLDKIFTNISNWYHSPVILPTVTKSDHNTVLFPPIVIAHRDQTVKQFTITVDYLILTERLCYAITSNA